MTMLPTVNYALKTNKILALIADPLEQFNFFGIFKHDYVEDEMPQETPFETMAESCDYDVIAFIHNDVLNYFYTTDYYLRLAYYLACEWVLVYIPTPIA